MAKREFSVQELLTHPLEPSSRQTGHYEERLRSIGGDRVVWTRVLFDKEKADMPVGAVLCLTVGNYNLMHIEVSYSAGGQVNLEGIGIGMVSDSRQDVGTGFLSGESLNPGVVYLLRTDVDSGYWRVGGSIGASRNEQWFEIMTGQGFFDPTVFKREQQPIDVSATAEAFLAQLDGYLRDPRTFEPGVTPNIQPRLVPVKRK